MLLVTSICNASKAIINQPHVPHVDGSLPAISGKMGMTSRYSVQKITLPISFHFNMHYGISLRKNTKSVPKFNCNQFYHQIPMLLIGKPSSMEHFPWLR